MRYFNKKTRNEAVKGFHDIESDDVIELPDDHFFFQDLPDDCKVVFKEDGMPDKLQKFNLTYFQKKVWNQVKKLRRQKNLMPVESDGESFDVDSESWENLTDALKRISLPDAPETREWTTSADEVTTLTQDGLKKIITARIDRKDLLHRASQYIRKQIFTSDDPESLDVTALYEAKIKELKEG